MIVKLTNIHTLINIAGSQNSSLRLSHVEEFRHFTIIEATEADLQFLEKQITKFREKQAKAHEDS